MCHKFPRLQGGLILHPPPGDGGARKPKKGHTFGGKIPPLWKKETPQGTQRETTTPQEDGIFPGLREEKYHAKKLLEPTCPKGGNQPGPIRSAL